LPSNNNLLRVCRILPDFLPQVNGEDSAAAVEEGCQRTNQSCQYGRQHQASESHGKDFDDQLEVSDVGTA
jgi:hypothetical protein